MCEIGRSSLSGWILLLSLYLFNKLKLSQSKNTIEILEVFLAFISFTIFWTLNSLLLISIPTARLFFIFASIILGRRNIGKLSIASNPISSRIFKAVVLPAPDNPVTIKIYCNFANKIKKDYERYLINNFNKNFKIINQKTRLVFSSANNPYI